MTQLSRSTQALIQSKVALTGANADDVVCEGLMHVGEKMPWRSNDRRPVIRTREEFIAALEELSERSAARPAVDNRNSDEELIGYDDFGLPR